MQGFGELSQGILSKLLLSLTNADPNCGNGYSYVIIARRVCEYPIAINVSSRESSFQFVLF